LLYFLGQLLRFHMDGMLRKGVSSVKKTVGSRRRQWAETAGCPLPTADCFTP
jgi:hypothetical protein